MSRKRGKQRKATVEAVPEDVLAEGSGPVHRVDTDAIATVEDVVTTDDIATTDDVVTADDVVATNASLDDRGADADAASAAGERGAAKHGGTRPTGNGNGRVASGAKAAATKAAATKTAPAKAASANPSKPGAASTGKTSTASRGRAGASSRRKTAAAQDDETADDAIAEVDDARSAAAVATDRNGDRAVDADDPSVDAVDDSKDGGDDSLAAADGSREAADHRDDGHDEALAALDDSLDASLKARDDGLLDADDTVVATAEGLAAAGERMARHGHAVRDGAVLDGVAAADGRIDGDGEGDLADGDAAGDGVGDDSVGDDSVGDDSVGDDDEGVVVFPTSAASMDAVQLRHLVEALIFASDRPLTVVRLRQLTRVGDVRRLEQALTELADDYRDRGVILQQVSGGYQFRTRTQFSAWVQQLIAGRPVRLSRAQLETLAIIAYRQPITRPEIDDIRGVDSTATLKLLIDRMLIRVLGKREEVGRPMLYGTTKEFLDFFSLGDLRELPTLREYSELTAESRKVMSDRLGLGPDGGDGGNGTGGPGGDGSGGGGSDGGDDGPGGGSGSDDGSTGGGPGDGSFGGGPPPGDGGLSDTGSPASAAAASTEDLVTDGALADETVIADGLAERAADALAALQPSDDPGDEMSADDAPGDAAPDALSVFWAASDAVDRSSVAAVGEADDDAPADTWFDPAIGSSLDEDDDATHGDGSDDRVEPVAE